MTDPRNVGRTLVRETGLWQGPSDDGDFMTSHPDFRRLARVACLAVTGVGAAIVLAALGARAHDGLEIAAELAAPVAVACVAAGAGAALLRAWRSAVAALVICVALVGAAEFPWSGGDRRAAPEGVPVRLYFANVGRQTTDFARLERSIRAERPDVIALVETPDISQARLRAAFKRDYPYQTDAWSSWSRRDGPRGFLVLSRWPLVRRDHPPPWKAAPGERAAILAEVLSEANVPRVEVRVAAPGSPFRLAAVQVSRPWPFTRIGLHAEKMVLLERALRSGGPEPLVLVGDFNATPRRASLESMAERLGLTPAPSFPGTWPAAAPSALRVGIDNAFVGGGVEVRSRRLGLPTGSDHAPVVVDLSAPRATVGR